jgi:anaerobic selenocysteine-containing dehydrogenase
MAPTLKMGVDLSTIAKEGAWQPDIPHVPYLDRQFPTPTGRFRLLDEYEPPAAFDSNRRFTLMSVAPAQWLCSEISPSEHVETLPISMSRAVARELDLSEGELVVVHNDRGRLKARLSLSDDLRPDLVVIPRGGWDARGCNVNVLTKALLTKVGAGTAYYQARVDVAKIKPGEP